MFCILSIKYDVLVERQLTSLQSSKMAETDKASPELGLRIAKKIKASSVPLWKLPPEIRIMSYPVALRVEDICHPTTPTLLAALRPDPDLYNEALAVYYEINIFEITVANIDGYEGNISEEIISQVRAVNIQLE